MNETQSIINVRNNLRTHFIHLCSTFSLNGYIFKYCLYICIPNPNRVVRSIVGNNIVSIINPTANCLQPDVYHPHTRSNSSPQHPSRINVFIDLVFSYIIIKHIQYNRVVGRQRTANALPTNACRR